MNELSRLMHDMDTKLNQEPATATLLSHGNAIRAHDKAIEDLELHNAHVVSYQKSVNATLEMLMGKIEAQQVQVDKLQTEKDQLKTETVVRDDKKEGDVVKVFQETPFKSCPEDFIRIGPYCYYISPDKCTQREAFKECQNKHNSALLSVRSHHEMDALTDYLIEVSMHNSEVMGYWTSLTRKDDYSEWTWGNGDELSHVFGEGNWGCNVDDRNDCAPYQGDICMALLPHHYVWGSGTPDECHTMSMNYICKLWKPLEDNLTFK